MSFENPTLTQKPKAEVEQNQELLKDDAIEAGVALVDQEADLKPATEKGRAWMRAFMLATFLAAGLAGAGSEAEAGIKNPFKSKEGKQEQTTKDDKGIGDKALGFLKKKAKEVETAAKKVSADMTNKINDAVGYEGKATVGKDGAFKFDDGKNKEAKVQGKNQTKYGSNALTRAADERDAKKTKK